MNNRTINEFVVLLKRELWECRNLFLGTPLVLTILLIVIGLLLLVRVPEEMALGVVQQLGSLTDGARAADLAPLMMVVAVPYMIFLYICVIIYLMNSLYQDRKDASILFWQSMPVSNLQTVLSKVVTVSLIAPLFVVAAIFVFFIFIIIAVTMLGMQYDVAVGGLSELFMASLYCSLLVYLSAVLAALWLFPTAGWFLLFSAFARSVPYLWALGAFVLLLLFEDFVFGTQFLANWLDSRTSNYNYIIFQTGDFFSRLFSYDMLIGVAVGALLITGAVYMRRFTD